MKLKNIIKIFILILTIFSLNFVFADNYKFDPSHTAVLWKVSHFDFSYPSGKWMANGTLMLDTAKPENSKVDVTVKINKLITGDAELNKHLAEKLFFDAAKYPTATFVSNKVEITGKNTANVYGMLTLHGVTKPIVLNVILNKIGVNPVSEKQSVGFSAYTIIKRSDFGINGLLPNIGDDVKLDIEAEAYKVS